MDLEQAQSECVCHMCPTYRDCDGEKIAFCLWPVGGRSSCIAQMQGCICPGCPVYIENEFVSEGYYCMQGTGSRAGQGLASAWSSHRSKGPPWPSSSS